MNFVEENAIRSLKEAIQNDARFLEMKKREAIMMESEEVLHLSKRMELASEDYSFAVSSNDKPLIEKTKKALAEAKLKLDTHPLVKAYTEAYIQIRDLYMNIDDVIFGPYRHKILKGLEKDD